MHELWKPSSRATPAAGTSCSTPDKLGPGPVSRPAGDPVPLHLLSRLPAPPSEAAPCALASVPCFSSLSPLPAPA